MSHQGYAGWFPECILCGAGNLNRFVCITPLQEEEHGLVEVDARLSTEAEPFEADGHAWKRCALCTTVALADPFSWGSVGYCTDCWNSAVRVGVFPRRLP